LQPKRSCEVGDKPFAKNGNKPNNATSWLDFDNNHSNICRMAIGMSTVSTTESRFDRARFIPPGANFALMAHDQETRLHRKRT
jgi:hypothetical protein